MIGRILRLIRETNNLSEELAAKEMGLKVEDIRKLESDLAESLSIRTLRIIANFYDIPLFQILCLDEVSEETGLSDEDIIEAISIYYLQSFDNDLLDSKKIMIKN